MQITKYACQKYTFPSHLSGWEHCYFAPMEGKGKEKKKNKEKYGIPSEPFMRTAFVSPAFQIGLCFFS